MGDRGGVTSPGPTTRKVCSGPWMTTPVGKVIATVTLPSAVSLT
jgi:hypothetical protein